MKRRILFGVAALGCLGGILIFGVVCTAAREQPKRIQYVTSIEIQPGDSLWSIAEAYLSEEYQDIPKYVEEIKRCNRLYRDEIHAGQRLIIPYYTTPLEP